MLLYYIHNFKPNWSFINKLQWNVILSNLDYDIINCECNGLVVSYLTISHLEIRIWCHWNKFKWTWTSWYFPFWWQWSKYVYSCCNSNLVKCLKKKTKTKTRNNNALFMQNFERYDIICLICCDGKPCKAKLFCRSVVVISIISQNWGGVYSWKPSSWKTSGPFY